jgi:hypothetical protein
MDNQTGTDIMTLITEFVKLFGAYGPIIWIVYYIFTKTIPDREKAFREERMEQAAKHMEQITSIITSFKEEKALDREMMKLRDESMKEAIKESFNRIMSNKDWDRLIEQNKKREQ